MERRSILEKEKIKKLIATKTPAFFFIPIKISVSQILDYFTLYHPQKDIEKYIMRYVKRHLDITEKYENIETEKSIIGNLLHKILEISNTREEAENIIQTIGNIESEYKEKLKTAISNFYNFYEQYRSKIVLAHKEMSLEANLKLKLPHPIPIKIIGRIDAFYKLKDNTIMIVDYKYSEYISKRYELQTQIYAYLISQVYKTHNMIVVLYNLYHGKEKSFQITSENIDKIRTKLEEFISNIVRINIEYEEK
jgi:ATP-dependent exoDNAse (exonuclease V) beta subunit